MLGWALNLSFSASDTVGDDIYLSFPPFDTTSTMVFQVQVESAGGEITDTTNLQMPLDFVMADNPPLNPMLARRPGPLRGPRLVDRIHIKT